MGGGCEFQNMVRDGVVPIGEGVMRVASRRDVDGMYDLDVLEDGRIQWRDVAGGGEVFVFQSPHACYAQLWKTKPCRHYEKFYVVCSSSGEMRSLKEIKMEYMASKMDASSCLTARGVVSMEDAGDAGCGIEEYDAVFPAWSDRGPRSGVLVEGSVGVVRAGVKRHYIDTSSAEDVPLQQQRGRGATVEVMETDRHEHDDDDYYDGDDDHSMFECGLEEEVTVCQPGGFEHDMGGLLHAVSHDGGAHVGSGKLDMVCARMYYTYISLCIMYMVAIVMVQGLDASDVIDRIECCVEFILSTLAMGQLPVFSSSDVSPRQKVLFGIEPENTSSLDRFALFVSLLNTAHERLLSTGHRSTQRELYYTSKARDPSLKATQHADVLRNACRVLQVPRYSLGIDCCSKGLVYGPLDVEFSDSVAPSVDCSLLARGYSIPGCIPLILKSIMRCRASCILVMEKETMFQRFAQALPLLKEDCLLVTAKGYPDIATRAFLRRLHDTHPSIPMVGMVDWNPHGLHILTQYRFGSDKSPESHEFVLPDLHWLGLRMSTIKGLSVEGGLQEMTKRDYSLSRGLVGVLKGFGAERWAQELECMTLAGVKADFESLHEMLTIESICQIFSTMIRKEEWI